MHKNPFYLVSVMLVVASACAPLPGVTGRAAAQSSSIPGVLSGDTAPGGGTYSGFGSNNFNAPVLNASGQFAFVSNLSVSGGPPFSGLFTGTRGSIQSVALQGAAAPGGGTYGGFLSEVINTPGQVAFRAGLTSSAIGVYVGAPGSVQAVALTGTAAPSGGSYTSLRDPVLNDNGQVAFTAALTGGTSASGTFAGTPGSVQPIALEGGVAPGGGTFGTMGMPVINSSGLVAFYSNLNGAGAVGSGLFAGTPGGTVGAIIRQGDIRPGGGNFDGLGNPVLNAAGQVAFKASLTNTSASAGIFVDTAGTLTDVARQGFAAPRGGNYNSSFGDPAINARGAVAFSSGLTGGTSNTGIFLATGSSVQAIAVDGDAAPGGGTYHGLQSGSVEVNASGQVAFFANLDVGGQFAFGLYAGAPGNVTKIVRSGDVIDVDLGAGVDNRTVTGIGYINFFGSSNSSGGEDGRSAGFNDAGQLVYHLIFTDGSSGVFTSSVPEPTSLVLLSFAGLAVLHWPRSSTRSGSGVISS